MERNQIDAKMVMSIAASFLGGSFILIFCSFIQKIIVEVNPLLLKGYIVPFFYGGIVGSLLGTKCLKVRRLNQVLASRNNVLEGLLPICSHCKAIREPGKDPKDKKAWHPVENYLSQNMTGQFTHSICPDCLQEIYPELQGDKLFGADSK